MPLSAWGKDYDPPRGKVDKTISSQAPVGNRRMLMPPIGTCGTDHCRRAMMAYGGLGANVIEDAIWPTTCVNADGKPYDSDAKYTIRFAPGQVAPVRAFWSLALHNDQRFFTDHPIDRYAIGDRNPLKYASDGALTLYIQRGSPDRGKDSNWLPAPKSGGFSMNLRLYWPRPEALNGRWTPPPVKRLQ